MALPTSQCFANLPDRYADLGDYDGSLAGTGGLGGIEPLVQLVEIIADAIQLGNCVGEEFSI
jgi:hypothetical protein